MNTPYFKLKIGYGEDDYIELPSLEVSTATKAMIEGTVYLGQRGFSAGNNIIAIMPDINRIGGYNRGYKPNPAELEAVHASHGYKHALVILGETKDKILGKKTVAMLENKTEMWELAFRVPDIESYVVSNCDTGEKKQVSLEEYQELINKGQIKQSDL